MSYPTIGYDKIRDYAAILAERVPLTMDATGGLPDSENLMLALTFANELPDLWNREAWPELCDNLEAMTLTNGVVTKREAPTANPQGDILGVYTADPQSRTTGWQALDFVEGNSRIQVQTILDSVYVDWQLPPTELDDLTAAELTAIELPVRFRLPLALLGAAALLDAEDAGKAAAYRARCERELIKQASRIQAAWWRRPMARGV